MDIRPIRTDDDLRVALSRVEALWNAEAGTPEGDELDVLVDLVEAYETRTLSRRSWTVLA
jgi:HTH-type transcriptional regulator / antitoxin HigA